jgi:hypothetical protein
MAAAAKTNIAAVLGSVEMGAQRKCLDQFFGKLRLGSPKRLCDQIMR